MHIRRFLGKIAGAYLAIVALSASAYAVADVYPSHEPTGGWGHGPDQAWGHGPSWQGPSCADHSWGCGQPSNCCEPPCHQAPACGVAYNPPAYFNCNNCCGSNGGFFDSLRFRADFLWWRACEEGLSLGHEEFFSDFPAGESFERNRHKCPDFKYDPGFRIGVASICPCDCWDVALNWTHFHTKAKAHGRSLFGGDVDTIFVSDWERVEGAFPDFAKGRWTLNLDLLDLEFGRKFYVSSCFILRPNLGLRGARIDQGFRTFSVANRFDPYDFGGTAFFTSNVKAKNNFLGVGPRIGVDMELRLPCCITVFGQAAGSLVFGRFDRHSREEFEDFSDESAYDDFRGNFTFDSHSNCERCSRGMTDLLIGLKWEHCCEWCNRQHPLSIAFSWEHHAFYNFNNFVFDSEHRGCCGDLTTQGLTVSAEIGF